MRVMALFSTSFFAKYLRLDEEGPGRGHLCHTDTFLVSPRIHQISVIHDPYGGGELMWAAPYKNVSEA